MCGVQDNSLCDLQVGDFQGLFGCKGKMKLSSQEEYETLSYVAIAGPILIGNGMKSCVAPILFICEDRMDEKVGEDINLIPHLIF